MSDIGEKKDVPLSDTLNFGLCPKYDLSVIKLIISLTLFQYFQGIKIL